MGGGSEADFMIHGIMKYHLFGQELWITTTTVGMTIITIVLLILAFAANRAISTPQRFLAHSRTSWSWEWRCWKR